MPNPNEAEEVKKANADQQERDEKREQPDLESDVFSSEEQKLALELCKSDNEAGIAAQADWLDRKKLDFKCYDGAKPSDLEDVKKKPWMSDRNSGLFAAIADTFVAVLKATCWNPSSIEMIPTAHNSVDRSKNLQKFNLWSVGKDEGNTEPEVHDFIHNRVVYGFSAFKTYWKVWFEWVDLRMPKFDEDKKKVIGYDIKTDYKRFEKGVTENIDDVDDVLLPSYGDDIQTLPWVQLRLKMTAGDVLLGIKQKQFKGITEEEYKQSVTLSVQSYHKSLSEEKRKSLGIADVVSEADIDSYPVEIFECYRKFTKNKMTEEYRFYCDFVHDKMLAAKPIRKLTRTGKRPIHGGGFVRIPGQVRGKSLMKLIFHIVCWINNALNQKSDFQYVNNCPFGFRDVSDEEGAQQEMELTPLTMYGTQGNPQEKVWFPNLQRSLAWAESDFRIFFELLERVTGAATYFMTQRTQSNTLGQDMLVDKASETRMGMWVSGIIRDLSAALTLRMQLYQDWAPPNLGERVLGEEGKQLFPNLSIDDLRGNYECLMKPDLVAGSKALRQQMYMWGFTALRSSVWVNPQVNPKGSWNLDADCARELMNLSETEIKKYLGEEPQGPEDYQSELDSEWQKFKEGQTFEPPEGATPTAFKHLEGHMKQREKIGELDKEYRKNFEAHLFRTVLNIQEMVREARKEQIASQIAAQMISTGRQFPPPDKNGMIPGQPQPEQPPQPGMQPPNPGMPGQAPAQPMMPGMGGPQQ